MGLCPAPQICWGFSLRNIFTSPVYCAKLLIPCVSGYRPLPIIKYYFSLAAAFAACLLCLMLLVGCGGDKLPAVPEHGSILAYGDSLTSGYGVGDSDSYPSVLAELSRRQVINAGIAGETTAEGLARLPAVLDAHSPDLLLLLEGGNDILRGLDLNTTKQHLAGMIELAQQRQVAVILIGVPEKKLFSNTAPLYQSLADQYQLVFADNVIAELLRDSRYKSDSIHFNEAGYRKLAEYIHELLISEGAL